MTTGTLYLFVGVVALLATGGRGDDPPPEPDHIMTEAELLAYDAQMEAAIEETEKNEVETTPEDLKYLNMTFNQRAAFTDAGHGLAQGRGVTDTIGDIVKGAVTISGIVEKLGDTATSVVNSLVDVAKLGYEIGKELNRLKELKEEKTGFLKGILYELEWQTNQLCNVVVFNMNKKHEVGLKNVILFKRYEYEGTWIGVWVAESGYFKNKALFGANEKWGFAGSYNVHDGLFSDKVVFNHRPCKKIKKKRQ